MNKLSREYLLPSILACAAAALGLTLATEWVVLARQQAREAQKPPLKVATAPDAGDEAGKGKEFELPEQDDYHQMAERPLFMENRKPGAEASAEPPPPPPPSPMTLKLMGIVWTPQGKLALVTDAKGKYKRLKPQDSLEGWTLTELGSDKVTMIQGDKHEELTLLKKRPKIPSGQAPGAGQPPVPGQPPGVPGRPGRPMPPVPAPVQPDQFMPDESVEEVPEESMEPEIPDEGVVDEGQ